MEHMQTYTIGGILRNAESSKQNAIAIQYYKKKEVVKISYPDFIADVKKMVFWVHQNHLKGKKIALLGNSDYPWLVALMGIMCSGSIVIPLDKTLSAELLTDQLLQAEVDFILYGEDFAEVTADLKLPPDIVRLCFSDAQYQAWFAEQEAASVAFCEDEEQIIMFLYTSGTTGKNKIVMLQQKNFAYNVWAARNQLEVTPQKVLVAVPLCHAFGLISLMTAICRGDIICLNEDIRYVMRDCKMLSPSAIYTVPMIAESGYLQFQRDGVNCLQVIITAGAPLRTELVAQYQELGICLMQSYGLTEVLLVSTNLRNANKPASVGRTGDLSKVKIVDGEIWVSSNAVSAGYYQNEAETQKSFVGEWYRTGDIGSVDADGFLYITGRIKNLIIREDGNNVSPEELEQRITAVVPDVEEVLVKLVGNRITAELYCGMCDTKKMEAQVKAQIEVLNEMLPDYAMIEDFHIRKEPLERTNTKKIKRG